MKMHLRLTINADMKVSEQCGIGASKGNQIQIGTYFILNIYIYIYIYIYMYIKNKLGPNTNQFSTPLKTDFQFETSLHLLLYVFYQ